MNEQHIVYHCGSGRTSGRSDHPNMDKHRLPYPWSASSGRERGCAYITGDVTKPETLDPLFENTGDAKVIVLHCAGLISIQKKASPAVYRVNVTGTRNVIAKCQQYGVHRLVYVSSVYALPERKGAVIREVDRLSPNNVDGAYAKTYENMSDLWKNL